MSSVLDKLRNKIFKGDTQSSHLTDIIALAREFGMIGDILGRTYEIRNPQGDLMATIKQKPLYVKQLNTLLEEVNILHKQDEAESNKKTKGSKGMFGRKGR